MANKRRKLLRSSPEDEDAKRYIWRNGIGVKRRRRSTNIENIFAGGNTASASICKDNICEIPAPADESLCSRCAQVDFLSAFCRKTKVTEICTLQEAHANTTCPLCRLVVLAVRERWGGDAQTFFSSLPNARPIRCYLRGQRWIRDYHEDFEDHHRLHLAINVAPPSGAAYALNAKKHLVGAFDLVKLEPLGTDSEDAPAQLDRLMAGPCIDVRRVRHWLSTCELKHDHDQIAPPNVRKSLRSFCDTDRLRVLNVETGILESARSDFRYLALSYVWGGVSLENSITQRLEAGLSVLHLYDKMPRTLRDAIELTRQFNQRYIWIDQLCVPQLSLERHQTIRNMDLIYQGATCTIVAAAGSDANHGLSGVQPSPRRRTALDSTEKMRAQGFRIGLAIGQPPCADILHRSVWNTRGWTYQEHALSQRCLYFTENEAFFACLGGSVRETLELGPEWDMVATTWGHTSEVVPEILPYRRRLENERETFDTYTDAVRDYSRREISRAEDTLDAFYGVLKALRGPDESLTDPDFLEWSHGLPGQHFGKAILWLRDPEAPPSAVLRRKLGLCNIPSWSWAAWSSTHAYLPVPKYVEHLYRPLFYFEINHSVDPNRIIGVPLTVFVESMPPDWSRTPDRIYSQGEATVDIPSENMVELCIWTSLRQCKLDKYRLEEGRNSYDKNWYHLKTANTEERHLGSVYIDTPVADDSLYDAIIIGCQLRYSQYMAVVILIEWRGDYAERVAGGTAYLEEWNKPERGAKADVVWTWITLR